MRNDVVDALSLPMTQQDFAELVGISQPKVSNLLADGVLDRGATGLEWLRAYAERLREMAAGRQGADAGGLDLVQERAALARAQRESQEMKNSIVRQEYAPVLLLAEVLATASQAVVDRFDRLPLLLKTVAPEITEVSRQAIDRLLADARNEWVRATLALVRERHFEDESEDETEADADGELDDFDSPSEEQRFGQAG